MSVLGNDSLPALVASLFPETVLIDVHTQASLHPRQSENRMPLDAPYVHAASELKTTRSLTTMTTSGLYNLSGSTPEGEVAVCPFFCQSYDI